MSRRPSFPCIMATLLLAACNESGGWVPDASPDTAWDAPADADAASDTMPADSPGDGPADALVDPGPSSGPSLLYSGARDEGAAVPGWSPEHPRPLIVFARYSSETVWHVSMAEVSEAGVVGGMVTDLDRFWGWGDLSAEAPSLLFEGSLGPTARIPGWSAADPIPVIALTRYTGSTTWFVSMIEIARDGTVSGPVTDEVKVWGWMPPTALGAPSLEYDGPLGTAAHASGWSVDDPPPLVVLARPASSEAWWLSMAEVAADGVVGGIVADRIRIYGW